ncbi:MAG: hypothetical protein V4510_07515 [bacterium]
MTKGVRGVLAGIIACAFLAGMPLVAAHGAPDPREIDQRVLMDDGDGGQDYGGCPDTLEGQPCPTDAGAMDLLALDVREAYHNGSPALALRIVFQVREATHADRKVDVAFKVNGQDFTVGLTGDGKAFAGPSCMDAAMTAVDVGDGTPKAIECFVSATALNLTAGMAVSSVTVLSSVGTTKGDYMPGGWYSNGQMVPAASPPDDPTNPEVPAIPQGMEAPGAFTTQGPAALLNFTADAPSATLGHGPAHILLTIQNTLRTMPQLANLTLTPSPGITVALDAASVNLPDGTAKTIALVVTNATRDGSVTISAATDLGGLAAIVIPVTVPAMTNQSQPPAGMSQTTEGKKSPDLGTPLAGLAVATALLARRRSRT